MATPSVAKQKNGTSVNASTANGKAANGSSKQALQPSKFLTDDERKLIFYRMLQAREFDLSMIRLYKQGRAFGGVYSQIGNEATAVASAFALLPSDAYFPMHRDVGGHFVRGQELRTMLKNFLAREGSAMRGTDGTGHYADVEKKVFGNVSHLGAMIPVAAGYAMAAKMRGETTVAMTYIGDGGSNIGDFHEAMNFATVQRIPLVLIIENNQYAYSTPSHQQYACERLSDRAKGYGCFGETVDGTDAEAVFTACKQAVDRAREEGMPSIIECVTMRMRGHAEHDDFSYVPREQLEYWQERDPIDRYAAFLVERGLQTEASIDALRKEISHEMNTAIDEVVALPFPKPEEGRRLVFVE